MMLNFSQTQFVKMFILSVQKEKELFPTVLLGHFLEERKKLKLKGCFVLSELTL